MRANRNGATRSRGAAVRASGKVAQLKPCRILIADDHALLRAGLRRVLERLPAVKIVGDARNGFEALAAIESLQPDLVLLDIAMPDLNGLDAATRIASHYPGVKVIILSMHKNEEYVIRALRSGVAGYLLKESATGELDVAIAAVHRGGTYLSPGISRKVIDAYVTRVFSTTAEPLTPRQREILTLVANGQSTKDIAFVLDVSVKTVESHRAQLMQRLGIYEVAGLVKYAMRAGLIPPAV
jgi:DNA-binding NarL/FixJ family response regulator